MSLPSFIIIGAMKSATTTLQEQLVRQPGIFMCEPKEPNYFSDDDQYAKGMDWYEGLFANAPENALLGEASTHYTKIPTHPNSVERIKLALSKVKLIYVMRHPIDRLVSHYIHQWSMGIFHETIDEAVTRHPELVSYGQYAMQLQPYFETFGRDAVLPVFFDRLVSEPQAELERVCQFIGYNGKAEWKTDLAPSNVSSQRIKRFPLYSIVIETGPAIWVRRAFLPQSLRNWVKSKLTIRNRPKLSDEIQAGLEVTFNQDLEKLGNCLGIELNCKNFKHITSSTNLNWTVR